MLKINNKGQSLVMFVLIIPIFLLILTLVYDVGNAIYEKDRLSNTNYLTIEYGLNNIDTVTENDLKNLIEQNTSNLKYIYVTIEGNQIEIKMEKDAKSIIGKMFNFNLVKIISHYKGKIINNQKEIERIV
ncbi:MAG: TadE/TadG family type IV pilus assembly protein [Bacilli bacterium]|nr:TadE/TadG family type IV pilus assembly protein [Bacilli bacterium]